MSPPKPISEALLPRSHQSFQGSEAGQHHVRNTLDIRNLVCYDVGMTDNDLSRLDEWLTAERETHEQDDDAIITRRLGACIHCGDEGCSHCEPDDDYCDDEYEASAAEARYERSLGL